MVMKMASGDNCPLRQSAGKSSRTPRDGFDDGGGVGMFCGIWLSVLGIFLFGEYMGEEAESAEARGPTRPLGAARPGPAPRPRVASLLPLFDSPSDSVFVS